jgi:signal-transduction protein with cAMP-binding, CBS, and nucleotidyltransferase domain
VTVKLVRDLMHIGVTTCLADAPLGEAVRTLLRENLGSLIVLDNNGHAVGMLSQREVIMAYARSGASPRDCETRPVAQVMRPDVPEVPPDIPAIAAAQIMLDQGIREIYLMHHAAGISWPAAVLRLEDVLRYLTAESETEIADLGVSAPRKSPIEGFMERYSKAKAQQRDEE